MSALLRTLRFFAKAAAAVALLAVLLVGAVYGLLRSGLLTGSLDAIITALAQKKGVFFVRVEGVSGEPPEHLVARKVEVGDYYGVWMTIEDVDIRWHPFDLFHVFDHVKWRIHVDDAHARRLAWTRLQKDGPDEVDEPFHWDKFIRIVIGHVLVDDFDLSGPILDGHSARLRAEGSGVLGEWDHGFVLLDAEHIDGRTGRAHIDLKTQGSPLELTGRVTAEEAPGGALASLARLTDAGSVTLEVNASGALKDWHGSAVVHASNIGHLEASTSISFVHEGPFEVNATFDPVAAQRHKWLVGEGGPMSLHAKGAWVPHEQLRLDPVELVADGRVLKARGRLDLLTHAFDVRGDLAHQDEGGIVRTTIVDVLRAKIEGRGVLGDGGNLEAVLDLASPAVGGVSGRDLHATLKAEDPHGDGPASFRLDAKAGGLVLDGGTPPVVGDELTLRAGGRADVHEGIVTADNVRLEGTAVTVEGPLALRGGWGRLAASLHLDANDLSSFERTLRTRVRGALTASVDVSTASAWEGLELAVSARTRDVAIGETGWNALLGGAGSLDASYKAVAGGGHHGELLLETTGLRGNAKGDVDAGGRNLRGEGRFTLDNLAGLAEPARAEIAGRLDATVAVSGDVDRFDANAALSADRFSWAGRRFDRLKADAKVRDLPHSWSADVDVKAGYGKVDAALGGRVSMPGGSRLVVRNFTIRGPQTTGSADLDVDLAGPAASGRVQLKSTDLAAWRPMTNAAIGGSVDLDATLATSGSGSTASQKVSGHVVLDDLVLLVEGGDIFFDALDAKAENLDVGPRPRGHATIEAKNVHRGRDQLALASVTLDGDGRAWNVVTKLELGGGRRATLDASASLLPGPPLELALAKATGSLDGRALVLHAPAKFRLDRWGGSLWAVEGLDLGVGDGRLTVSASRSARGIAIDAAAKTFPLAVAALATPALDLEGTVDGTAKLAGASLADLSGDVSVDGRAVASTGLEAEGVSPVDVEARARVARGRLSGSVSLAGLQDSRLALTLEMPLAGATASSPFVATLVWNGDLAETAALLPIGESTIGGRIDADLRVSGTVAAPRVSGRATLDGGKWDQALTGLQLRDIHAELDGSGTTLELTTLTATDGEAGRIGGRGLVRFGELPAFDAEFDLDAKEATLARLDLVTAKADAQIAVKASRSAESGAGIGGLISGTVALRDTRIQIPQRFIADVPEIDFIEVGADAEAEAQAAAAATRSRADLGLDIAVRGDNRIFVSGRGLESEWSSDVHVGGSTRDPRVSGKVTSVRGQLSLLGRRFDVTTANLRFDGEKGNIPWVTMTARAETNDITAIAEVTGPATRPAIELRSEPSLPRDEVLSRVLFGQSAANLTPIQSVQLAQSVAELTGNPLLGGPSMLGGIGRTLGFDRLGIESSGKDGAAALTASKYLTDSVYLRVQQGLTPEASKLSIEWQVMKHVTIESDISQDAQGEVGATWHWDY